jgi:hypothetical protein
MDEQRDVTADRRQADQREADQREADQRQAARRETARRDPGDRPVEAPAAQPAASAAPEPQPRARAADAPAAEPRTTDAGTADRTPATDAGGADASIWDAARAEELRGRWHHVQTGFVDDPKSSVASARALVDEAMQGLEESVRDREEAVERSGARAADSTEGMRDAVQQYHRLLDRLLSV